MALTLGPILGFRGSDAKTWKVSALIVVDSTENPTLTYSVNAQPPQSVSQPATLAEFKKQVVLRFDFDVLRPAGKSEATVKYEVAGSSNIFFVPGQETSLQMAYTSCNGFSSPAAVKGIPKGSTPLERWQDLLEKHKGDAERGDDLHFHLLLMGGDQVYGDSVFAAIPELQRWSELDPEDQVEEKPVPKKIIEAIDEHYFKAIYCSRWSAKSAAPVAQAMASIPSLMMWDDHDIFDGWGSYDAEWLAAPIPQAIFQIARKWFRVFQQRISSTGPVPAGNWPNPNNPGFSWFRRIDNVGILAPDLRSERSMEQILSTRTWNDLIGVLDSFGDRTKPENRNADGLSHLLVMSSIPVIYPSFEYAEALLGLIPGHQDLEDDMRDHWRSRPHMGERRRLIRKLFDFATNCRTRVTILSGDVHVPAMGLAESSRLEHVGEAATITQLISTGIVHPSGGAFVTWALDKLFAGFENEVERGITERMLELPDSGRRMLPKRNWLALEFSPASTGEKNQKLWARWWLEGEKQHSYTKVIGAVT